MARFPRALGHEIGADELLVERFDDAFIPRHVRTVRRFDLDDIGAENGKLIGAEGTGEHVGHVDDPDAFEGAHGTASLGFASSRGA